MRTRDAHEVCMSECVKVSVTVCVCERKREKGKMCKRENKNNVLPLPKFLWLKAWYKPSHTVHKICYTDKQIS